MGEPETISDAEIEHLKRLARLEMSAEDTARAREDLNRILGYFRDLQALDTAGLPELPRPIPLVNVLRDDDPQPGFTQAEATAVALEAEDGFFRVPRTVE